VLLHCKQDEFNAANRLKNYFGRLKTQGILLNTRQKLALSLGVKLNELKHYWDQKVKIIEIILLSP
jgi:hypothetical protein